MSTELRNQRGRVAVVLGRTAVLMALAAAGDDNNDRNDDDDNDNGAGSERRVGPSSRQEKGCWWWQEQQETKKTFPSLVSGFSTSRGHAPPGACLTQSTRYVSCGHGINRFHGILLWLPPTTADDRHLVFSPGAGPLKAHSHAFPYPTYIIA